MHQNRWTACSRIGGRFPPDYAKIFKKTKFRDDFVNGLFYINKLGYFQEYERRDNDQFDIYEGSQQYLQTTPEFHWSPELNAEGKLFWQLKSGLPNNNNFLVEAYVGRQENVEKKIFCMYTLWGDSVNKYLFQIDPRIIDVFGEYAVVLKNTPLFIQRVKDKAKIISNQMANPLEFGFVDYINKTSNSPVTSMGVFTKFQVFQYQNEFRFCFDMKDIEGPYTDFHIEISDICTLCDTRDLANMTHMDISGITFGHLK